MMDSRTLLASTGLALVAAGCESLDRDGFPAAYRVESTQPAGAVPVSRPLVIVSDNQLHNLFGRETGYYRTFAIDRSFVREGIRPPALELYSEDLLRLILDDADSGPDTFIVHGGDACDVSCLGEYLRFARIMFDTGHEWAIAPGNHDGYYLGNEHPAGGRPPGSILADGSAWVHASEGAGPAMDRARFLAHLVATYIAQCSVTRGAAAAETVTAEGVCAPDTPAERAAKSLADALGVGSDWCGQWNHSASRGPTGRWARVRELILAFGTAIYRQAVAAARGQGEALVGTWQLPAEAEGAGIALRRLAWRIDAGEPWRSFLLQDIDVSGASPRGCDAPGRVRLLMLDTNQHSARPTLAWVENAGVTGNVLEDQLEILRSWLRFAPPDVTWVAASHHPFSAIGDGCADLRGLFRRHEIPLHITGHTHEESWTTHRDSTEPREWLEMNVASTTDWPMSWRRLRVHRVAGGTTFDVERKTVADLLGSGFDRDRAFSTLSHAERLPYDRFYYAGAIESEIEVKNALLGEVLRLLEANREGMDAAIHASAASGPDETSIEIQAATASPPDCIEEAVSVAGAAIIDVTVWSGLDRTDRIDVLRSQGRTLRALREMLDGALRQLRRPSAEQARNPKWSGYARDVAHSILRACYFAARADHEQGLVLVGGSRGVTDFGQRWITAPR